MTIPAYSTREYRTAKRELRGAPCWMCGAPSDSVDHFPPLATMQGRWSGLLRPACMGCQRRQAHLVRAQLAHGRGRPAPLPSRVW